MYFSLYCVGHYQSLSKTMQILWIPSHCCYHGNTAKPSISKAVRKHSLSRVLAEFTHRAATHTQTYNSHTYLKRTNACLSTDMLFLRAEIKEQDFQHVKQPCFVGAHASVCGLQPQPSLPSSLFILTYTLCDSASKNYCCNNSHNNNSNNNDYNNNNSRLHHHSLSALSTIGRNVMSLE